MIKPAQAPGAVELSLYELVSLVRAENPEGCVGTWYRYVIGQGTRQITGRRSGSRTEVNDAVNEMLDRLNERTRSKAGAARSRKKVRKVAAPEDVSKPAV